MEPQGNEQSPSASGSEMESDGDSEQEDELDNDRSRDSDAENQDESDKENSDNSDDDDEDDNEDDDDDEEEEEEEEESDEADDDAENQKSNHNATNGEKNYESPYKQRKSSSGSYDDIPKSKENKQRYLNHSDVDNYPMDDLPLEVITTVEPTNYSYPVLKNMSNGVLTHRNIFTEHEREVLKEIINKYRNIVDTRSRTREIYLEKQSVWQQIVEEYNSTENIMVRTEKELRKCWDNMKYRAKQAEKGLLKVEKVDMGFDGMDLHTLAQQAMEDAVRLQQAGPVKMEQPDAHVKIEPVDHDNGAGEEDGDSNPEMASGEGGTPMDDDREPALKRARQESPKLSSLLLAGSHKHNSLSKKSGKNNHKKNGSKFPYSIPECTKVVHMKKKSSNQNPVCMTTTASMTSASDLPVSILPKGLGTCLSITNIPNPVSLASHIGSNYNYQHKEPPLPLNSSLQTSMKPMPSLKKMVPGKQQTNGNSKSFSLSKASKRSSSHGHKDKGPSLSNSLSMSIGHGSNSMNSMNNLNSLSGMGRLISSGNVSSDSDKSDSNDRQLSGKLTSQRLEFERREHELRMKVLEKELQAQSYQSQYWALKLKFLRSGRESNPFNMAGATNGDID